MTVRTLMAATALLYLGPLLAGLAGFGWPLVYAFAAIFTLWLMVMRPADWPRDLAAWRQPAVPTRALTQVLVQLLLVAVLFGIGRGIGGVAGYVLPLPVVLPLAVSFLSVPLSRLVWNPTKAAQMDAFLTDAIAQIEGRAPDRAADRAADWAQGATCAAFLAELQALPDDTPLETLKPLIWRAIEELDPSALQAALAAAAPRRVIHVARILQATEGSAALAGGGDLPTRCLAALPEDPELIGLFAGELAATLDHTPELWGASPNPATLQDWIDRMAGGPAEAPLRHLQAVLRALDPD